MADEEVMAAIEAVKKTLKPIKKTRVSTDGYKYITLDDVLEALKKVLPKHKLSYVQYLDVVNGQNALVTVVYHTVTGQRITSTSLIPDIKDDFLSTMQSVGSNITYMRRYALCTIFGIVSDDDTDGQSGNSGYSQKDKNLIEQRCKERQLSAESIKKVKEMTSMNVSTENILRKIDSMK